jgi:hypothetical protein
MPSYYRALLICFALAGAWFTLRAIQTGVVRGKGQSVYKRDEDFGMYAIHIFGMLTGITICVYVAAGYNAHDFFTPLGLGAFFPAK